MGEKVGKSRTKGQRNGVVVRRSEHIRTACFTGSFSAHGERVYVGLGSVFDDRQYV